MFYVIFYDPAILRNLNRPATAEEQTHGVINGNLPLLKEAVARLRAATGAAVLLRDVNAINSLFELPKGPNGGKPDAFIILEGPEASEDTEEGENSERVDVFATVRKIAEAHDIEISNRIDLSTAKKSGEKALEDAASIGSGEGIGTAADFIGTGYERQTFQSTKGEVETLPGYLTQLPKPENIQQVVQGAHVNKTEADLAEVAGDATQQDGTTVTQTDEDKLAAAKAEATELGIQFPSNIGLATLNQRIAAKKAENDGAGE